MPKGFVRASKLNAAISQPGAHAIIYGERGVGKTSLANIGPISYAVEQKVSIASVVAPRIACDSTDTFDSIWKKVFKKIYLTSEQKIAGFLPHSEKVSYAVADEIEHKSLTPGDVLEILDRLGRECDLVVAIDEFDRLPKGPVPLLVADLIKSLSDNHSKATVVIVGVGDSITELVRGHESVGRHIVEIPLPRMSRSELEKIVETRLPKLTMGIEGSASKFVSLVCAGLPYYTHLLGQHAVCRAIASNDTMIKKQHVNDAMKKAIEDSEREMKTAFYEATHSRQPNTQFTKTLAACALAKHDDFGYFTAANVREPLGSIRGRETDIPEYKAHLDRFCKPEKGAILQVSGETHQKRYRFRDPLMQPFIIIRSLDDGIISETQIKEFSE